MSLTISNEMSSTAHISIYWAIGTAISTAGSAVAPAVAGVDRGCYTAPRNHRG